VADADHFGIINAVPALSAHELNVPVFIVNEDENRSAAQDM
jgi:hypothetical protein